MNGETVETMSELRKRVSFPAIRKALIDSGMPNPPDIGDWPLGVIVGSILDQITARPEVVAFENPIDRPNPNNW